MHAANAWRLGVSWRWISGAMMAITLAGCAANAQRAGQDTAVMPMNDATPVGAPLAAFLERATTGSAAVIPSTPWGANVSVQAGERYFAASGRQCLHLEVAAQGAATSVRRGELACLVLGQGWYAQRLITDVIR